MEPSRLNPRKPGVSFVVLIVKHALTVFSQRQMGQVLNCFRSSVFHTKTSGVQQQRANWTPQSCSSLRMRTLNSSWPPNNVALFFTILVLINFFHPVSYFIAGLVFRFNRSSLIHFRLLKPVFCLWRRQSDCSFQVRNFQHRRRNDVMERAWLIWTNRASSAVYATLHVGTALFGHNRFCRKLVNSIKKNP